MSLIVVIEDDLKIQSLLVDYLRQDGFATAVFDDGDKAIKEVSRLNPDLILLDVMLPKTNGFDVCRAIRAHSNVPILFLTARISETDRLRGLELGGDDYILKPFSPREVVARVKANLRRLDMDRKASSGPTGGFHLDRSRLIAANEKHSVSFTQVEFELLSTLFNHPGQLFSRDQLIDRIYADARVVSDRTVDSHIKKVRNKLEAMGEAQRIEGVYGAGYRYKEIEK